MTSVIVPGILKGAFLDCIPVDLYPSFKTATWDWKRIILKSRGILRTCMSPMHLEASFRSNLILFWCSTTSPVSNFLQTTTYNFTSTPF